MVITCNGKTNCLEFGRGNFKSQNRVNFCVGGEWKRAEKGKSRRSEGVRAGVGGFGAWFERTTLFLLCGGCAILNKQPIK